MKKEKVFVCCDSTAEELIQSLPMLKGLRGARPSWEIFLLIKESYKPLLDHCTYVDEIHTIPDKTNLLSLLKVIAFLFKRNRFKAYLHLQGSFFIAWLAFFFFIPWRGGYLGNGWFRFLLPQGVCQSRVLVSMHEVEYNLNLLAPLGFNYQHDQRKYFCPEIKITEAEKQEGLALKEKLMTEKERELFILNTSYRIPELNWSVSNYVHLLDRLEKKWPKRFHYLVLDFLSFPSLAKQVESRGKDYNSDLFISSQKFIEGNWRTLLGLLSQSNFFMGPGHESVLLAAILKIPTLGFYPPVRRLSFTRLGPFPLEQPHVGLFSPQVVCGEFYNCAGESCLYYECMPKIVMEDILEKIDFLLENKVS